MKLEYQRNPTEHVRARLDDKLQTLRRVENELIHADRKVAVTALTLWRPLLPYLLSFIQNQKHMYWQSISSHFRLAPNYKDKVVLHFWAKEQRVFVLWVARW